MLICKPEPATHNKDPGYATALKYDKVTRQPAHDKDLAVTTAVVTEKAAPQSLPCSIMPFSKIMKRLIFEILSLRKN